MQEKCIPFWWVACFYFRPELKWAGAQCQTMIQEFINEIEESERYAELATT